MTCVVDVFATIPKVESEKLQVLTVVNEVNDTFDPRNKGSYSAEGVIFVQIRLH